MLLRTSRAFIAALLTVAVWAFVSSCGSDGTTGPATGDLAVSTSTTGMDPDPDGYTVTVDGSESRAIPASGTVTFADLETGSHVVQLTGLASNCSVTGSNPRTVSISADEMSPITFQVTCLQRIGNLQIHTTTGGTDLDSDGYTVTVNGGSAQSIGLNATVTLADLAEGDYQIALSGIAANCAVVGSNPRNVTVNFGQNASTTFNVTCSANVGDLEVTAATTGPDPDPDGYSISVDGGSSQAIGANGTVTFADLAVGDHSVAISGVAANCAVGGNNPRTVSVPLDGTASTTFNVTCSANVGDLEVTAATTGPDPDPDGYTITVDGGSSQAIGVNGTVTFADLPVGDHSVAISGLAANCAVGGSNPRTVNVPLDGTAATTFNVTCAEDVGDLEVKAATTGPDPDPNGYTVTVDGGASQAIGVNGTVTFTNLAVGSHTVQISGVAANCTVGGDNPRTVSVTFDATASTTFDVTCTANVGDLEVSASTTGPDPDPNGYTVTVDGSSSQPLGVNGTVTFADLAVGDHSVTISGVAANCAVGGSNPRTLTVPFSGTATTTFNVTCVANVGDLEVTASTTGSDQDPDGYTITVDGGASQPIDVNGTVTFADLDVGDHSVAISGVAPNCAVQGSNPRTVSVPLSGTASTTFEIECVANVGDLDVTTSTTGVDLDPDGYTVTVDGGSSQAIGVNTTVTFADLAVGDHSVALTGVEANCAVGGDNPRTVTVPLSGTIATTFNVVCSANVGNIEVSAPTSGVDLDADGYTVTLDGTLSQNVATGGMVSFNNVASGDHTLLLSGIASNCTVTGDNPRTVTVAFSQTTSVAFEVTCASTTGDLVVSAMTSGANQDNSYTVQVDGGAHSQSISKNGTVEFEGLAVGDHEVRLTGIAANCYVDGENPRTVTVPSGESISTTFVVKCFAALSNSIVFHSNRNGTNDIVLMNLATLAVAHLTSDAANDVIADVSPDGLKIVFFSNRSPGSGLYVMNADGSQITRLTTNSNDRDPRWSPDASKIAFSRPAGPGNDDEIFVINVDGTGLMQLTHNSALDKGPAWSPNGGLIAFHTDRDGDDEIYVMNSDGSEETRLTTATGRDSRPAWSPNGTKIVYDRNPDDTNSDIWVMDIDAMTKTSSNHTQLTTEPGTDWAAIFSKNGSQIFFTAERDGNKEIYVMNAADGSGQTNLTTDPDDDAQPSRTP